MRFRGSAVNGLAPQPPIARTLSKGYLRQVTDPNMPHRRLHDARELMALAHPVRMGIIEHLSVSGPLTATELADRLDESPANCSWHLRKLAEHGFVEEAGGGIGRKRPWRGPASRPAPGGAPPRPPPPRAPPAPPERPLPPPATPLPPS